MNKNIYDNFIKLIDSEDKDNALLYVLDLLEKGENLVKVYEELLIPSLLDFQCKLKDKELCIWREHTRTSIIRTILEATYKFVIKEKQKQIGKKIIVLCPKEEYHEIGAIMASHYFSMVGFDSAYIGANTPTDDILSAVRALKPDYIAFSVTNYYNLVVTKRLTEKIRNAYPDLKIVIGGQAFENDGALEQVSFDYLLKNYNDIVKFREEVVL